MVVYAHVSTNIKDIISDPVDESHGLKYTELGVILRENLPGKHRLNLSEGTLFLGNLQCPENPLVYAMVGSHTFEENKFNPREIPVRGGYTLFPTLFELERIAPQPVMIKNIEELSSDGITTFSPEHTYFREQQAELSSFSAAYVQALEVSAVRKPVVEGFYRMMKDRNIYCLEGASDSRRPELGRQAMSRLVNQESNFQQSFGIRLYRQLKEVLGEPTFES